jgi:hypothetical protein
MQLIHLIQERRDRSLSLSADRPERQKKEEEHTFIENSIYIANRQGCCWQAAAHYQAADRL